MKESHKCWTILYTLASLALIIFVTGSAALVAFFPTNTPTNNIYQLNFVKSLPKITKYILIDLLPAVVVFTVNAILIYLGGETVNIQRHTRFSIHQAYRLRKIFPFLHLNSNIVPGLFAVFFANIYEVSKYGNYGPPSLRARLFFTRNADFFIVLVLVGAGNTFMAVMNYLRLLLKNYLSPLIALKYRTSSRQDEHWVRENGNMWGYASNYAITIVYSGIGILFQ